MSDSIVKCDSGCCYDCLFMCVLNNRLALLNGVHSNEHRAQTDG